MFFDEKIFDNFFFRVSISIPNFPKIPKITLRTACDHYKNTNNAHEIKVSSILIYFPSDPVLGGRGSWTFCTTQTISSRQCRVSIIFLHRYNTVPPSLFAYSKLTCDSVGSTRARCAGGGLEALRARGRLRSFPLDQIFYLYFSEPAKISISRNIFILEQ